jgi:hypothetical protein
LGLHALYKSQHKTEHNTTEDQQKQTNETTTHDNTLRYNPRTDKGIIFKPEGGKAYNTMTINKQNKQDKTTQQNNG